MQVVEFPKGRPMAGRVSSAQAMAFPCGPGLLVPPGPGCLRPAVEALTFLKVREGGDLSWGIE